MSSVRIESTSEAGIVSVGLPRGTLEEGLQWVGRTSPPVSGAVAVNLAMAQAYAALVEDGNASYWDHSIAEGLWGGLISPPGMLHAWVMPWPWQPDGGRQATTLAVEVPLPGSTLINVGTDTVFYRPISIGSGLSVVENVESISGPKSLRIGTGHFVVTVGTYRDEQRRLVATHRNINLRFAPGPHDADPPADATPAQANQPGEALPELVWPVSYHKVTGLAAATLDYFPGHHDPHYARRQGMDTIYLGTMALSGIVDRVTTDWAGPNAFIHRRVLTMRRPVVAGSLLRASGVVRRRYVDEASGDERTELLVTFLADDTPAGEATITLGGLPQSPSTNGSERDE